MKKEFLRYAGAVLICFSVVGIVSAATTISTSISTGGDLTVTGTSALTGAVTTAGDVTLGNATADVILSTGGFQASSTALFVGAVNFYGNMTVDKAATTTVTFSQAGINFDSNTFVIDPNANRVGVMTATPSSALDVTGTTTSSAGMVVGSGGTAIARVLMGTCTYNPGAAVTASTTRSTNCTSATGVRSADKIFVTPSTLETHLIMTSASSTATSDVIQVSVYNTGVTGDITPASATWTWMAIR